MKLNKIIRYQGLLTFLIILGTFEVFSKEIKLAVFSNHYQSLSKFIADNGCIDVEDVKENMNQMLAEFLLLCRAFEAVQYKAEFKLVPFPVMTRIINGISNEDALISSMGIWSEDIRKSGLNSSAPLIESGKFSKGFYTTKQLADDLAKSFDVKDLLMVTNQNWSRDLYKLNCTGGNVLHVNRYQQMFNMIDKGRADVILYPFSNQDDLTRHQFKVTLYPVKGIKVVFDESLEFAVNDNSAFGKEVLIALNDGLKILKENGVINKAYKRLGHFNEVTNDWKVLECG